MSPTACISIQQRMLRTDDYKLVINITSRWMSSRSQDPSEINNVYAAGL